MALKGITLFASTKLKDKDKLTLKTFMKVCRSWVERVSEHSLSAWVSVARMRA
jgi:hypothetical protein